LPYIFFKMEPSRRRMPVRANAAPPPIGTNPMTRTTPPPPPPPPPPYRSSPPPPPQRGVETESSSSSTTTTVTATDTTGTSRQDDIFAQLQVAWQWDPSSGNRHSETDSDEQTRPRSHTARLPTVVFVSIPAKLSNTRLFLFDRGNLPLPTGTAEPSLMTDARMMTYLNSSTSCFKIGGLQDGISSTILARFFLRVANIRIAGAVCRSRGMWCIALQSPLDDRQALLALHEKFWFTPLGIIDVSSPKAAAEVNVILNTSRHDARTKGYPRHLMTVTHWTPNRTEPT